jgi:hypothetical protein
MAFISPKAAHIEPIDKNEIGLSEEFIRSFTLKIRWEIASVISHEITDDLLKLTEEQREAIQQVLDIAETDEIKFKLIV